MEKLLTWIGKFLLLLNDWTNSYILAIFLFAVIVEVLMLPFGILQQKNSIKQAKLRPKEMAIRKKYDGRNDRATQQKVAQEVQELYQKENFNQFAGCLPTLLTIPVLLILYYVVINPLHYGMGVSENAITAMQTFIATAKENGGLELFKSINKKSSIEIINLLATNAIDLGAFADFVNAGAIDSIKELAGTGAALAQEFTDVMTAGLPKLTALGLNLGEIPTLTQPSWLWTIPVLTFVSYFFSMKLTRKLTYQPPQAPSADMGCSNKMMDITMPAMSVYITFIVPAAIGVYWIFKSIIGTLKQYILYKFMPLPEFSEEEYRAAEKELAGKQPAKKKSGERTTASGTTVRSLHHIDDDDYLPPVTREEKAKRRAEEEKAEAEAAEKAAAAAAENNPIEQAPMKDDFIRDEKPADETDSANSADDAANADDKE